MQVTVSLRAGHQAMVFVHSRKDTGKTGRTLIQKAQSGGDTALFNVADHPMWGLISKDVKKSRNKCALSYLVVLTSQSFLFTKGSFKVSFEHCDDIVGDQNPHVP